jgi:hypothetical protein
VPLPIATATAEHDEELWGEQKIKAKETRLWSGLDRN